MQLPSLPDLNSRLRLSGFDLDGELDQFSVDIGREDSEESLHGSSSEGKECTTAIRDLL